MLDLMRKHAYSWMTRAVVIVLIAVFAFWGVSTGMFSRVKPVASVDGHQILTKNVEQEAQQIRRQLENLYGAQADQAMARFNVRRQALEELVNRQLLMDEARRLGLRISKADLEQAIASQKAFQRDGHFDIRVYQAVLRANGLRPAEFESDTRVQMLQDLMRRMVAEGVAVSDAEARHEYDQRSLMLSMSYVEFPYADFTAGIAPNQKQIADYYKKNREQFRQPERISFEFIRYSPDEMGADVKPSEKEIADYYKRYRDKKFTHPEEVRARHILIAVPPDATVKQKAAAKAKAEDILKEIKKGADFAKLAKKYSDDPGTKNSGGDLGYFTQHEMVKPFADAAFKLKPGGMTVVQTRFGYHVIQVEDHKLAHIDTLAEARPEIINDLRHRAGVAAARDAVDRDLSAALTGEKLEKIAKKRGFQLMITPYMAINERTPYIGDRTVMRQAFKLKPNEVRVINGRNASFLAKLIGRKPSYVPALKDIKTKVDAAVTRHMAEMKAQEKAAAFLKQAKEAKFDKAASDAKLKLHATGEFSRGTGSIPTIGNFPDAIEAAVLIPKVPGVIDHPLELDGNSYVFQVTGRAAPGEAQWKHVKKTFMRDLVRERRMEAWNSFLQALRDRAQIVVHQDRIGGRPAQSSM